MVGCELEEPSTRYIAMQHKCKGGLPPTFRVIWRLPAFIEVYHAKVLRFTLSLVLLALPLKHIHALAQRAE